MRDALEANVPARAAAPRWFCLRLDQVPHSGHVWESCGEWEPARVWGGVVDLSNHHQHLQWVGDLLTGVMPSDSFFGGGIDPPEIRILVR